MKKYIIAIVFIAFALNTFAQDSDNPLKAFWKKEKLKINVEDALKIMNSPEFQKKQAQSIDMKNMDFLQADNPVFDDKDILVPESEIHSAINPTNPLNIVTSPIRQNTSNPTMTITCPVYYTKDGGKSWKLSNYVTKPPYENFMIQGGGDPMFAFDADGNLYMSWINLFVTLINIGDVNTPNFIPDSMMVGLFYARSTNGGETWIDDGSAIESIQKSKYIQNQNPNWSFMLDKQWMASDLSNSKYRNNMYLSAVKLGLTTGIYNMVLYRKPAGSKDFLKQGTIINTSGNMLVQFGNVDVDHLGNVHYTFLGINASYKLNLFHCISTDGGATFSNPVRISEVYGSMRQMPGYQAIPGVSNDRCYPAPYMAVDKSNGPNAGNIYMTWTANGVNSNLGRGHDVFFSYSSDQGKTWSKAAVVNDNYLLDQSHSFYSNIAVNDSGVVAIAFYDRRNDIVNNIQTDYYLAYSFDGGKSFDKNIKLTSKASNFANIGNRNGGFGIGEYNGLVMSKDYAMPFWADGRTNNGEIIIYTAQVPIVKNTGSVESIKPINNYLNITNINPNPAQNSAKVDFTIIKDMNISLELIDIEGNSILSFENQFLSNGNHTIELNLSNIISGNYYIRVNSDFGYAIRKLSIVK